MMKRRAKVDYARWVFVLPALLVVGILLIYPIFSSLYYSMTTKHLIRLTYDFIGLENYKAVLADPNFFKAFLNSVFSTSCLTNVVFPVSSILYSALVVVV